MPHLLTVMLKVTRSGEPERKGGEREMEESESEREEGMAASDVRNLKLQHSRAVCFQIFKLMFHSGWILIHPHQSPFSQ